MCFGSAQLVKKGGKDTRGPESCKRPVTFASALTLALMKLDATWEPYPKLDARTGLTGRFKSDSLGDVVKYVERATNRPAVLVAISELVGLPTRQRHALSLWA